MSLNLLIPKYRVPRRKTHSKAFIVSMVFLCALCVELLLFWQTSSADRLIAWLQRPYREEMLTYDVGSRTELYDNQSVAIAMSLAVRVHCLIMVDCTHDRLKVKHVRETWGPRCNSLHVHDSVNSLYVYIHIYMKHKDSLDWLLHVNIDNYVIVENLRFMVSGYEPSRPLGFFARHAAYPYSHVVVRNTTDYILSRGALLRLAEHDCSVSTPNHRCLIQAGILLEERLELCPFEVDEAFLPLSAHAHFWYKPHVFAQVYGKINESTANLVVLPYVLNKQMHVVDFLLYHMRAYGHVNRLHALPATAKLRISEISGSTDIADELFRKVRIMCLVETFPKNQQRAYEVISKTWGRHCNKLLFFSTKGHKSGKIIALNITEGYSFLWGKTKAVFRYIHEHHRNDADWFFKADDDTFAIMANMRYLLHSYSPEYPLYFGCQFNPQDHTPYMSGGAGYVISRAALSKFILALDTFKARVSNRGVEDMEFGKCMSKTEVEYGNSLDARGRNRFIPLNFQPFLIPDDLGKDSWLWKFSPNLTAGLGAMSSYAITFHYIALYEMQWLEYMVVKLRPYGIINGHEPLTESKYRDSVPSI